MAGSGGRVLLVDDSEIVLSLVGDQLRDLGFDVSAVDSAQKGLHAATTEGNDFDLFILDVLMPEMDGFDLARALRTHPTSRKTAILFLTTLGDIGVRTDDAETKEQIERALEAGGDDFMGKNSEEAEIAARVTYLVDLSRRRKRTDAPL